VTTALARTPAAAPATDRDLSWIDFDRRILELAAEPRRPLAERVKLFAIVAANLDDFFAVRGARVPPELIRRPVLALQNEQGELWQHELRPALAEAGIELVATPTDALARTYQRAALRGSSELRLGVLLRDAAGGTELLELDLPADRFVEAEGRWIFVEDAAAYALPAAIDGRRVVTSAAFRLTRSAELLPARADSNPLRALEHRLAQRQCSPIVRLEVARAASGGLTALLCERFNVAQDRVYRAGAPLGLADLQTLADALPAEYAPPPWSPLTPMPFAGATPAALLDLLRDGDRLVHHPYQSFEGTVQAFADAARDDDVTALRATVYRTSRPSATLASLVATAGEGKRAECVVELRARFDEERNVEWSRALMASGVDVAHGRPGAKVHAKLMSLTRREQGGPRRYVHIGTGNYHASNAFSYEDLSLFSADEDLAADVEQVFAAVADGTVPPPFRKLLVAPWYLRDGLLREFDAVTAAARVGARARIRIKVNALGDAAIVDAIQTAACAGARVELIVRGICTLRPGGLGVSDRITVRSVLGRFLEHSRIFCFEAGRKRRLWLGSADLLTRNLDKRIETLAPVENSDLQDELVLILDTLLADTRDAWSLGDDGVWRRVQPDPGAMPVSAQETFMRRALDRARRDGG
jgi:polyphosphate kinase